MTEDQVTEETTEEQTVEPEEAPTKKLSMVQRMDRVEEFLVKAGVIDAASLGR